MSHQIRIADEDIELCKIDKRKRYGIESIGKIPKGTSFKYREAITSRFISASVEFGKYGMSLSSELATDVLVKSSVKPCESASEVFMLNDMPTHCSDELLEHMVKAGFITTGQLDLAIKSWYAKINSEG